MQKERLKIVIILLLFVTFIEAKSVSISKAKIALGEVTKLEAIGYSEDDSFIWKTGIGHHETYANKKVFYFSPKIAGEYIVELFVNGKSESNTTVTVTSSNSIEHIEAGNNQNICLGETATLTAIAPSNSLLEWKIDNNKYADGAVFYFVPKKVGVYTVTLTGNNEEDNLTVTVNDCNNHKPIANAGADQTIATSDTQVQLDGSASSDADSDPLTYQWTMVNKPNGSSAMLSDTALVNPTFVADKDGIYTIQLIVNDGHVNSVADTVVVSVGNNHLEGNVTITIEKVDKQSNSAKVHIVTDINEVAYVFDNNKTIPIDEGTIHDGYIILHSGKHYIKLCSDEPGTICSFEQGILVSHNIDTEAYKKYSIEIPAGGLTNNGTQLVYAGRDGNIYTYNLSSKTSTLLVSTGNSSWTGGLAYVNDTVYYFSKSLQGTINKINPVTGKIDILAYTNFPDGLDIFNNKIYTVTNDVSGVLSIFNLAGEKIGTLSTTVPDITGITHTQKYLYILSEDGNIFQVNPSTGATNQIFTNDNLFTKGNNYHGLEAITILNNYIYVSYIDDVSIYKIDINLNDYE